MGKILVIGSSNMDYTIYLSAVPKAGETVSGFSRSLAAGGKGANQAIASSRALAEVTFFTSLGSDPDGKKLKDILKQEKINLVVKDSKVGTGNATILVEPNGENRIIVVPGSNHDLDFKDIPSHLFTEADIIVLQNEIKSLTNAAILKEFGESKTIILNPAPSMEMDESLYGYISYFIVNEGELKFYSKGKSLEEGVEYLLNKGIKNILVTFGAKGSCLYGKGKRIKVEAFKVKAIDTVGAGDTYLGYFAAGLAKGLSEEASMVYGSKASSISVTRKGAIPSIPHHTEVL